MQSVRGGGAQCEVQPWPDESEAGSNVHGGETTLGVRKYICNDSYTRSAHSGRDQSGKDQANVHQRVGDRCHTERGDMWC